MRAVVCTDFGSSSVRDVPKPAPAPGEVLVEVERVQLSVTECNLYRGNGIAHYEQIAERLREGDARLFGHEFSGIVVEVGADVDDFSPGQRVFAPGKIPCEECRYCRTGYEIHCEDRGYVGYTRPGALAEFASLPAVALQTVPPAVSPAETAALQPLASAVLCVRDADIDVGDAVAVVGTGVMGYQVGQLALANGASRVLAVDVDARKLRLAEDRGMIPVDANEVDPVAAVRERTNGIGADVVCEAVGGAQSHATAGDDPLAQAYRMVRSGGAIVQIGHVLDDIELTPRAFRSKSVDWRNPASGAAVLGPNADSGSLAARMVAQDRVSVDEYVTHALDGLDSFEEAVEMTLDKRRYDALGPAQMVV